MGRTSPTRHGLLQLPISTQTYFLGLKEERLLKELAATADWCIRDFKSQAFANTARACATVGYEEEWHFTALAAATKWLVRNFKAQDLTNTAWEFATIGQKDERLFTVLARKDVNP